MRIGQGIKYTPLSVDTSLLFVATSLLPVYTFGSGGIQPAHLFFAFFAVLVSARSGVTTKSWALLVLCLFIYAFVREGVYILFGGSLEYLINAIYLGYNFVLVSAVYQYVLRNGLSTITAGLRVAVLIVVLTIAVKGINLTGVGEGATRSVGTFNNPNQLGYFSVCLLSLTYLFHITSSIKYRTAMAGFFVAVGLSIISLSKAAIIANGLLLFIILLPRNVNLLRLTIWAAVVSIFVFILLQAFLSGALDSLLFIDRLMNMGRETDTSLSSRGYFAVLGASEAEIIFGLGSEKLDSIVGHEVHSTFGSIFNNYGLAGLVLGILAFATWSILIGRSFGFTALVCLIGPAMLYGLTHNGIRFSIFWILFASSAAMAMRTKACTSLTLVSGRATK